METNHALRWCSIVFALASAACGSATGVGAHGIKEVWYETQVGDSRARPAVAGELVFFGTGNGRVIARNIQTGAAIWATAVSNEAVNGSNLVAMAGVVVAPVVHEVIGLNASTGAVLWRYNPPLDTAGVAPPDTPLPGTVTDGRIDADSTTVYIPAWGASVSALDIRTGQRKWVWQAARIASDTATTGVFRSGSMSATVYRDTVFATVWHFTNRQGGTSDAWVLALNAKTGAEYWGVKLPDAGSGTFIEAQPRPIGNLLIVRTLSGHTYALTRAEGQITWQFAAVQASSSTVSSAEVYSDIVYVDGGDGKLYALRGADGSKVWASPISGAVSRDMLVTQKHIVFPIAGSLYFLDRETGREVAAIAQPHTNDPLFSSAASGSNGRVFVSAADAALCVTEP